MSHPTPRLHPSNLLRAAPAPPACGVAAAPASALGLADPEGDEQLVPFLDPQPDPQGKMTKWDELRGDLDWITPTPRVFHVGHYPAPKPIDVEQWKLRVTGQVERPIELTLDEIKLRPKQDSPRRSSAPATARPPASRARSATAAGPARRWPRCSASAG